MAKANIIRTGNLGDLLNPVEKVDTELVTGMPANSEYKNLILVGEQGSKKVVNACSDRYELIPVANFAPQIIEIIKSSGVKFEESYRMVNDAVFYGSIIIKDDSFYIGDNKDDVLNMRLQWSHSYNGLEQYELNLGTFHRYLCSNGLWITGYDTEKNGLAIKGKHTAKINQSLKLLREKLNFVLSGQVKKKFAEIFTPLYDNWVADYRKRVEEVMKASKIGVNKPNMTQIIATIEAESKELYGGKVNDWLIYNAFNKFIFDDNNNVALESRRRTTDSKVFQYIESTLS